MIWLTWRQHRSELAVAGLLVALFGVFALWSGLAAHAAYTDDGVAACLADPSTGCGDTVSRFVQQHNDTDDALIALLLLLLPPVAGMFVGAPLLAREFEDGTWQLAWTQSVPRQRWLAFKLALVTAGVGLAAAAVGGIYAWWHAPFDRITPRFDMAPFEFGIPAFTGHAVFAFAVGALAGTVIRRSIPAMGVTLVVYLAVAIPIGSQLRPHYMDPLTTVGWERPGDSPFDSWGDWVIEQDLVSPDGRHYSLDEVSVSLATDSGAFPTDAEFDTYLQEEDLRPSIQYHPASRYWAFQLIEAAISLALAGILLAAVIWRLHLRAL